MDDALWKDQIMKKDISYLKKNQVYKQKEFENMGMGEESFSMNEIQNASLSIVNSD